MASTYTKSATALTVAFVAAWVVSSAHGQSSARSSATHQTNPEDWTLELIRSVGQPDVRQPWDVAAWKSEMFVSDREMLPGDSHDAGCILRIGVLDRRPVARIPQPLWLAMDPGSQSLIATGENAFAVYRIGLNGSAGKTERLVQYPPPTPGQPILPRQTVESIAVGSDGHIYYNNRTAPDQQSIVELDPSGKVLRTFGGWRPGGGAVGGALNKKQLRWIGGRLVAVGLQEGRLVAYVNGAEVVSKLVDTRPYNSGPRPVETDPTHGNRIAKWIEVVNDVVALGEDRLLIIVRQQREDLSRGPRIIGLVVNNDFEVTGVARCASTTSPDRLAPVYYRGTSLGNGEVALVDAAFTKRVDVFQVKK